MNATKSQPPRGTRELPYRAGQGDPSDAQQALAAETRVVEMEISWIPLTAQARRERVAEVADASGGDPQMYSVLTRLYPPGCEPLKRLNAARAALTGYRDSKTIPVAALPLDSQVERRLLRDGHTRAVIQPKQPGKRLILLRDVDEFHEHVVRVLIPNLLDACDDLNRVREDILAEARKSLGTDFDPGNYPDRFLVAVRGPTYSAFSLSVDFEKSCPKAAAALRSAYQQHFDDTMHTAAADFAKQLLELTATIAAQVGRRAKLLPTDPGWSRYREAEVVEELLHSDDPQRVPEGQVLLEVDWKPEGGKRRRVQLGPFTPEFYKETLRPYASEERGRIYGSTMERLFADLRRFDAIREMLGPAGQPLESVVAGIRDAFRTEDPERAMEQVRESGAFRDGLDTALDNMASALEDALTDYGLPQPRRRRPRL